MTATEDKIILNNEQPEKLHIQLRHFRQKYNWDCGISCVLMVLPNEKRQSFLKDFTKICKNEGFNRSTWTIDLCYLLKKFDVPHIFYTITLGVHEGHRGISFYRSILTKDENRVNIRFQNAEKSGMYITQASLSLVSIISHLVNGPIIILTNAKLLSCDICKFHKISSELRKCIPWPATFQGHYIVLCGYDIESKKIFYRNPSFEDHVCKMPMDMFDFARKSYGTDEDIIMIFHKYT